MRRLVPFIALGILGWAAGCGGDRSSASADSGARKDGGGTIAPGADAGLVNEANSSVGADGGIGMDSSIATDSTVGPDSSNGSDGWIGTDGDDSAVGVDSGTFRAEVSPDSAADGYDVAVIDVGTAPVDAGGLPVDAGAVEAATDTGRDGGASACNAPSCYADLMKACQPGGTCIEQSSGNLSNQCYSNGVKVIATIDPVALTMSTKVKNGAGTCYELYFDLASYGVGAKVVGFIKDGNGTTVATIGDDVSGRSVITCTGGQPVVLNPACDSGGSGSSNTSCDTGSCSP